MTSDQNETKDKIIATANKLFSQFGYEGTSIREIASESGVNVASINYYFKSKEALYWEIFMRAHAWIEKGIHEIIDKVDCIEEFVDEFYEFLDSESAYLRNTFRLMLSENIGMPDPSGPEAQIIQKGPPGGDKMFEFIGKLVDGPLGEKDIFWAVKSLFGTSVHWAIMCSVSKFELTREQNPMFSREEMKAGLIELSRAVINHLNSKTK